MEGMIEVQNSYYLMMTVADTISSIVHWIEMAWVTVRLAR